MRYDAFISYRHSELDMYIAKKIHKGLETFKVPRAVAKKTGKKNIKRVFRDQEELPIGSDLGDNIESALSESEYLLVICSPRTPESYWVQKEITTFIQMHGRERVLAVLVEGEPNESFPEQLLVDDEGNPVEPLAADVRGASKREINKKLKTEIMRLAAPLLHCSYDDLRQRHKERRVKRIAAVTASVSVTVAALALSFGAYSAYNAAIIQQNYEGKQRNQSKYLADTSLRLLEEGDRRAAVLVALEALPSEENDRPYVAEAQYALSEALYAYDAGSAMKMDRVLQHDLPVREFNVNGDGTRAVSMDQGYNIYVWDVVSGEKLAQIAPQVSEYGYIEAPVAAYVYEDNIIVCEEKALRAVSFDGQEKWHVVTESYYINCTVDEMTGIAACIANDEVVFYDVSTGEKVGNMLNSQESSYSSAMAFSEDKSKFVVSHYTSDEEVLSGCVTVYDFDTKESIDVETYANYITEISFSSDDCLVVAQAHNGDFLSVGNNLVDGYIQKIDYMTQEVLWQDSYQYDLVSNESASTRIKCRNYQDAATGEVHDEVMMSVDNRAYTWDNITGERIVELQVDSGIVNLLVSTNSRFGYLAQYDGTVDIVDMTSGARYSASTIETGKDVRQLSIRSGRIVFRSYASPNLTVMKYPDHADVLELATYDETIEEVCYSQDESYYAVNLYDFDVSSRIYFHSVSDPSYVKEWIEPEGKYYETKGFIKDNLYAVMYSDGTIMFYDVEAGEKDTLVLEEDLYSVEYDMNKDKTLALAYQGDWYKVVDLQRRELSASGEIDGYLNGAVLTEDGGKIICSEKTLGVCIIDVATGNMIPIELPGYRVLSGSEIQDTFAVSNNGRLVAVACTDGMLRIIDIEEMKTVTEIPFTGVSRSFIRFSDDDTKLMMQGDDYYFRVYDMETSTFCHVATDQYYEIEDIVVDADSGIISLITMSEMVLLNADDYERVAEIDEGEAYLPKHGLILSNDNSTMYQFPYMTLEMLQKEAEEQFGGEELTELERVKYNVE